MLQVDTLRSLATYSIAAIVVIAGFLTLRDPATPESVKLLWGGLMTMALTFVFGDQANTRGQRAFQAGTNVPTVPTTTVNASGDTNVAGPTTIQPEP
jgi:hypothetical protein